MNYYIHVRQFNVNFAVKFPFLTNFFKRISLENFYFVSGKRGLFYEDIIKSLFNHCNDHLQVLLLCFVNVQIETNYLV